MKTKKTLCSIIILLSVAFYSYSQEYHVRIAFIGNSITIGTGLTNPGVDCYPSQVAQMLQEKYGDTCIVNNFAVSGRTMLKNGDFPIWNETQFQDCWNFAPEIFFICMGTNDSKTYNWDVYGDQFLDDYMSMIDTFKLRNPHIKFFVCYPPKAFDIVYDIRDSVILHGVIPAVDSVLSKTDAELVDFYHPFLDSVILFPDKIHPNAIGAKVMADIVFDSLLETDMIHNVETGYTFVTSLKTAQKAIAIYDSAIISWTTINADTVFLNGQIVSSNGSQKVSPPGSTIYTVLAKGAKSIDSMKVEQQVYWPEITSLQIKPLRSGKYEGDSVYLKLFYVDQMSRNMLDTIFDASWSILEGNGDFYNETDTSVTFICGSAGKDTIKAEVGTLSAKAIIIVLPVTGINQSSRYKDLKIFPNPCDKFINMLVETQNPTSLELKLFDLKGTLQKDENIYIPKAGQYEINIKTADLSPGIYIYKVKYSGNIFSGKISKQADF